MIHFDFCKRMTVFLSIVIYCNFHIYAYDIAVKNEDGVTIYYNYINNGLELEVTNQSILPGNDYDYSQGYSNVTILKIPETVTYLNRSRKVTSISSFAFSGLYYIKSVILPNSIVSIGREAFGHCPQLSSITIGDKVSSIEADAFVNCKQMEKVIVHDISTWCNIAFCTADSNPLSYAHHIYIDDNTEIKDLIIPENVTSIGEYAFYKCYGLTSATIPNGVIAISDYAFCYCGSLKSVLLPKSIKTIGNHSFEYCNELTSLKLPDGVVSIGNSAFLHCYNLTDFSMPNSVSSIGAYVFSNCRNLKSINISNNIVSIPNYAFLVCDKLEKITIPNSVSDIGDYAFSGCTSLSSIVIPNNVTSIGNSAFEHCSSLTYLTIPEKISFIGSRAFNNENLTTVISLMDNPINIDHEVFSQNSYYNATLYIPNGTLGTYKSTDNWKQFVFIEEGLPEAPNAIENIYLKPSMNIKGELGLIRIDNAKIGTIIQVFVINGTKLMILPVTKEQIDISLPRNNIYIVKVASITKKIHL